MPKVVSKLYAGQGAGRTDKAVPDGWTKR